MIYYGTALAGDPTVNIVTNTLNVGTSIRSVFTTSVCIVGTFVEFKQERAKGTNYFENEKDLTEGNQS